MSSGETSKKKSSNDDYEEDGREPEADLDGMLSYGEKKNQAMFQASIVAKMNQEELEEIADRADHSTRDLLMRAKGDLSGSDAFRGKSRAILVAQALANLHGSKLGVVTALVVLTLDEEDGDLFRLEPVQGEDLLSSDVIGVMHRSGLLTDEVHEILTDGIDNGSSEFYRGDFITNKAEVVCRSHLTATERLRQRRVSRCRLIKPRLPPEVELAEIIRVDNSDSSLMWRDAFDRTTGGWVEQKGVRKVATTRKSGVGEDEGFFRGFGNCDI